MKVIMLGPPGAGKGTQAGLIARRFGIPHISTGDILRNAVREGTELGRRAKETMERGGLVSDEIVGGIVREVLESNGCARGYVLDGFPRTQRQAVILDEIQGDSATGELIVINVLVPDEDIIRRLSSRRVCGKCGRPYNLISSPPAVASVCDGCGGELIQRDDDRSDTIRQRLVVFHQQTDALITHYKSRGANYQEIDGAGAVEDVQRRITGLLAPEQVR